MPNIVFPNSCFLEYAEVTNFHSELLGIRRAFLHPSTGYFSVVGKIVALTLHPWSREIVLAEKHSITMK